MASSLVADYGGASSGSEETECGDEEDTRAIEGTQSGLWTVQSAMKDFNIDYFCGDAQQISHSSVYGDEEEEEEVEDDDRVQSVKEDGNDWGSRGLGGTLPKPNFAGGSTGAPNSGGGISPGTANTSRASSDAEVVSVFANPFRAAEDAKTSLLERHVKMTPSSAAAERQFRSINGRQVCWNYRKGRCRFGHNCKFAHDSDIIVNHQSAGASNVSCQDKIQATSYRSPVPPVSLARAEPFANEEKGGDTDEEEEQRGMRKRKKPGLSNTLIPPKRTLKLYHKQQQVQ